MTARPEMRATPGEARLLASEVERAFPIRGDMRYVAWTLRDLADQLEGLRDEVAKLRTELASASGPPPQRKEPAPEPPPPPPVVGSLWRLRSDGTLHVVTRCSESYSEQDWAETVPLGGGPPYVRDHALLRTDAEEVRTAMDLYRVVVANTRSPSAGDPTPTPDPVEMEDIGRHAIGTECRWAERPSGGPTYAPTPDQPTEGRTTDRTTDRTTSHDGVLHPAASPQEEGPGIVRVPVFSDPDHREAVGDEDW